MAKSRVRRQPQRTCIGCQRILSKRELVRIVRTPNDGVTIDPRGKMSGRGAYLCRDRRCWTVALEGGRIERALKTALLAEEHAVLRAYSVQLPDGAVEEAQAER